MIVNHTITGEIHSRFDPDSRLIEVYFPRGDGTQRCVYMYAQQARYFASTLQRLATALHAAAETPTEEATNAPQ